MYKRFFKRFFDIVFAIISLSILSLVFIVVAPLIKLSDGGPIFYNANRIGKNGKLFKMYKFRSMKVNAPDIRLPDGSTYNGEDDPRVTKIGKFLRKTSIDELPQLLNVLIGDMSLIGPRPDLPDDIHMYNDYQRKKLSVRPGITGYSQAYFRNSANQEEKFNNDSYYAENLTILFDIKIFFKTLLTVIKKENIYKDTAGKNAGLNL
jgi:undecaprenyl phosphate N,N'-diacetylbacillosamine 1-phosphate transferase